MDTTWHIGDCIAEENWQYLVGTLVQYVTILIGYLSQPYTRGILREQRKVQHLVQLDQSLLTRISQQEVPHIPVTRMRSEQMSCLRELPYTYAIACCLSLPQDSWRHR